MSTKFASERQALRQKNYKATLDPEEMRKRNQQVRNDIRKQRREENLAKKRNIGNDDSLNDRNADVDVAQELQKLPLFVSQIQSDNTSVQLEGATGIRQLLSIEVNPPISQVIDTGVVPRLVQFLDRHDVTKLQFEAAWSITNIASGNTSQTYTLLQHGAVPALARLLSSPDPAVREQATWGLGNIAGDAHQCRDYILQQAVMPVLLENTHEKFRTSLRRNAIWTISNLCRGKPAPRFDIVSPAIPVLTQLLRSHDPHIIADACWALSYISDGDNMRIQALLENGVCPIAVGLLMHTAPIVQTPALRVVGNIVTGDDFQTQCVLDHDVLPRLKFLLENSKKKGIKKEVCWALSNITAGNSSQVQAVIDNDLIEALIYQLSNAEFDIKKEAAWAIANATSSGTREQIQFLVARGAVKPLCDLLFARDPRIVAVSLEGLENILAYGENDKAQYNGTNPYAKIIAESNGLGKIEGLQTHPNNSIYEKAVNLMDRFFTTKVEEDRATAPTVNADGQSFAFGGNVNTFSGFNFN